MQNRDKNIAFKYISHRFPVKILISSGHLLWRDPLSMKWLKRVLCIIVITVVSLIAIVILIGCSRIGTLSQPTKTINPGESVTPSPDKEDIRDIHATSISTQNLNTTPTLPVTLTNTVATDNSGIKGVTSSFIASGVPGGGLEGGPSSVEFAIAPIKDGSPEFSKSIFITSDEQGRYDVPLPSGNYWIGPKDKALNPETFDPGIVSFSEVITEVTKGIFTEVDLTQISYTP